MRYAVVGVSACFTLGIGTGLCWAGSVPVWSFLAVAAGLFALALVLRGKVCVFRICILLAIGCLGAMRGATEAPFPDDLLARAAYLTEIRGTVVSYPSLGDSYVTFTLRPDMLPADLRVTWFRPPARVGAVVYGDRLQLIGRVELPKAFDGFDYPAYLARRNIFATMTVSESEGVSHVGAQESLLLRHGDRLRQQMLGHLTATLSPRDGALAQSLLFGDRAALPEDVDDAFSRTGLMHLLAVSGLHLGIVLAGAWFVLRWAGLRALIAYPLVGLLVILVLWIVGPRISLVRASLLFSFLALGSVLADLGLILRRSIRPINGLAAAAVAILILQPGSLADAGFQLTIAATAGILIAFSPALDWGSWVNRVCARLRGPLRWMIRPVLSLIAVSTAAQAGAAPVIAWHFGTLHPWALASNLVAIPLATATLWSGLAAVAVSRTPLWGTALVPFGRLLGAFSWTVAGMSRLPAAQLEVPRGLGLWMGGLVAFAFLAAAYVRSSSESTLNSTSITSGSRPEDLGRLREPPAMK